MGERSVRIRKAVSSNLIISIKEWPAAKAGRFFYHVSVAQWIEHRIPVPGARVRLLSDTSESHSPYRRMAFLRSSGFARPAQKAPVGPNTGRGSHLLFPSSPDGSFGSQTHQSGWNIIPSSPGRIGFSYSRVRRLLRLAFLLRSGSLSFISSSVSSQPRK